MATLTASSFSSTTSHVSYGTVSSGSNLKTGFKKMVSGKQTLTHNGLRALNSVDELRVRTMANSVAWQASGKSVNSSRKTSGVIVCGSGMNLVFLGTEVGPWSKTGGLGDVLGGLPPAMAVSFAYFSCLVIICTMRTERH
ncbi:granule-bound starch synthase 1, chloroplastic/amyloplastic-like [Malus sylvestris]|uniref:granule-bound starch synthase 1, chloroplastic/amyloplastic-like n=1 Tax=Malus sylvestris TaxID=3752 RepID=UPI0021AC2491|nr:granule-bound starch synthase 1, chloroplastic/amyloplastic-like [Malus sylvestris]